MTTHRLDPTAATTVDVFSNAHAPVLSIDPGDTVALLAIACILRPCDTAP